MTLPRRKLWRFFFWIAFAAILLEVLGLTNTFLELHRRNRGSTAGLAPDQIAGVVHLWPSLNETQRRDLLSAVSGGGISFRVTSQPPIASSEDARAREVEDAVRKQLNGSEANSVVALIRSSPGIHQRAPYRNLAVGDRADARLRQIDHRRLARC